MMHILTVCWEFSPLPPAAAAIAQEDNGNGAVDVVDGDVVGV